MQTDNYFDLIFLNIAWGIGYIFRNVLGAGDPVLKVLTYLGLAVLLVYNVYRIMNERQKYLDNKRDREGRGKPK